MGAKTIKKLIRGIKHDWTDTGHSKLTYRNLDDYHQSLHYSQNYVVRFQEGSVQATYAGQEYTYTFLYRDPWQWILSLLTDPTLASELMFYPVKKFLHENGTCTHLYDDVNTGQTWWNVQDQLPQEADLPHCFLPLHLWMDKGKVSSTGTMHPMLLQAGFLPHQIRNGSGNGGGVFFGYMPRVIDPSDPADRKASEKVAFGLFKQEVYHKVLRIVFKSLKGPSKRGETVKCADEIACVFFPGIPIQSLDGEEAVASCATRGASADHPCPRCLVHHDDLHKCTLQGVLRTVKVMHDVYKWAKNACTKAEVEKILRQHGLHLVENAFWFIANSDPYLANSYDLLHVDDIGKWGKHLWPLLLEVLGNLKKKGDLSKHMHLVPRWPNLKHFISVTTLEFSDGQGFLDVLKCILPCIVQLLPTSSPFVHCIRAYAHFWMLAGLHAITELQIQRIKGYLESYGYWCEKLSDLYGKDFNFPKQHAPTHLGYDIVNKGATNNYSTCVGEGFQQEVQQAYIQTNGKKVEGQMITIDENQEAIACIRMAVDAYDMATKEVAAEIGHDEKPKETPLLLNLMMFLHETFPSEQLTEAPIKILPHKCVYLNYQSQENWQQLQDIIRCNPSFQGGPRYDCVIINSEPVQYACLQFVFRQSKWLPKTVWEGCQVWEEKEHTFVLLKYLAQGCHMIEMLDPKGKYCMNDLIDSDMFLRCGN
ncbi:hypothetical protein K439DRAFT_1646749 [Ramaria rubella]|nr:hypothetical protein K439DRAFT_1646749 [Ramaria rubella]